MNRDERVSQLRGKTRTPTEETELQTLLQQGPGNQGNQWNQGNPGWPSDKPDNPENLPNLEQSGPALTTAQIDGQRKRLGELKSKPVASTEEHREIASLEAQMENAPGVPIETQAEKDTRENRQNREAAERAEVCERIASMNDNGWHGLREVLRQHGFGSLFRPDRVYAARANRPYAERGYADHAYPDGSTNAPNVPRAPGDASDPRRNLATDRP